MATLLVPITILSPAPQRARGHAPLAATWGLGTSALGERWQRVAAEVGLQVAAHGLEGKIDGIRIRVTTEHRDDEGLWLVAELAYPNLHLGLDGGLATGFRRVFSKGIALGHAAWDRRHYLTARDEAQLRPFLGMVAPLLVRQQVADLDDEHLRLERPARELEAEGMADLARSAVALARALATARTLIPPPRAMASARPSWRRLAQRLGSPLETARLAVRGRLGGTDVLVATEWTIQGEPLHTALMMRATQPIAEGHRLDLVAGQVAEGDPARFTPAARAEIAWLGEHVDALSIGEHLLCASLPAPLLDADPVLPVLEHLATLASLLCGRGGPYR